jgi:hypothetical protein
VRKGVKSWKEGADEKEPCSDNPSVEAIYKFVVERVDQPPVALSSASVCVDEMIEGT